MKDAEKIIKALKAFDGKSTILYDPSNKETITFQDVIDYVSNLQNENERLNDVEFTQEHCNLYEENEFLNGCLREQKAEIELHKIKNGKLEDELSSLKRTVEILTKREFDEQRKTYLCGKCQERVFNVYEEKETQISELQKQVDGWVRVHDEQLHCMQVLTIENNHLQKQVDELKKRLHWIWAIGVDYDGCDKAESLKELIDEMVEITQMEIKDFNRHYGVEVE